MTHVDATGLAALEDLVDRLRKEGIELSIARAKTPLIARLSEGGLSGSPAPPDGPGRCGGGGLMWAAFGWGLFASSSLILGGVLALVLPIRERLLGLIMGFGSGVLISAVAYELVEEAFDTSAGSGEIAFGLAAGALTFFVGDMLVDRMGAGDASRSAAPPERDPPLRSCSESSSTASPSRR